ERGAAAIAGRSISQSLTRGFGPGFTTVETETVAVDPTAFSGHILLRMQLDDATDLLTTSFSLDDGVTFQSPFPPLHVFNDSVTAYDVLLGAAGVAPNGPPPPPSGPPVANPPPPCTSATDTVSGAPWGVCRADWATAWLSSGTAGATSTGGGRLHAPHNCSARGDSSSRARRRA